MSGQPSTEGARALLAAITEAERIDRELPILQEQRRMLDAAIKARADRHAELRQEIGRLLDKMDTYSTGNHGWQGRFTALLSEVIRIDRAQRNVPDGGSSAEAPAGSSGDSGGTSNG